MQIVNKKKREINIRPWVLISLWKGQSACIEPNMCKVIPLAYHVRVTWCYIILLSKHFFCAENRQKACTFSLCHHRYSNTCNWKTQIKLLISFVYTKHGLPQAPKDIFHQIKIHILYLSKYLNITKIYNLCSVYP